MQAAITQAYTDPLNNNGITKAYQHRVPAKGEIPTPEEVIQYAAQRTKEKQWITGDYFLNRSLRCVGVLHGVVAGGATGRSAVFAENALR